ncbi:MAG: putative peptidase [Planctomycetota bacterium]|jgi:predicted peptidase
MEEAVDGQQLRYLIDVPTADETPEDGWPLLLFLHGSGERGDDLSRVLVHGPPKLLTDIPELTHCVLITPQCPENLWWQTTTLMALLDDVRSRVRVDANRIYITGLSMGGYGCWALLSKHAETFAAAVPICGGGSVPDSLAQTTEPFVVEGLERIRSLPIRVYHGDQDTVVPVEESRVLVGAIQSGEHLTNLTVYPGVGHDSWTQTYANPELYEWMFAQKRSTD